MPIASVILLQIIARSRCAPMRHNGIGTSTTDFTVLPADYFRNILTGAKIQCKWMRAQPEVKWVEAI